MAERSKRAGLSTQTAAICLDQRSRWHVGERITAEDYVRQFPVLAIQTELLLDVIYNEFLLRELHGPPPGEEEFCGRFPELQADLARLLEVHRAIESPGTIAPPDQSIPVDATINAPAAAGNVDVPSPDRIPTTADCERLADIFARGTMGPRQAARLLTQLCIAIHRARWGGSELSTLHPRSIVVDAAGHVELAETGFPSDDLRRSAADPPACSQWLADDHYTAPEHFGQPNDLNAPPADVFVLGMLLYEALTGRAPFHAANRVVTDVGRLHDQLRPPRTFLRSIPRELDSICMQCLATSPAERYASLLDLADDLQRFLAGLPLERCRPLRGPRIWRWWRRLTGG